MPLEVEVQTKALIEVSGDELIALQTALRLAKMNAQYARTTHPNHEDKQAQYLKLSQQEHQSLSYIDNLISAICVG